MAFSAASTSWHGTKNKVTFFLLLPTWKPYCIAFEHYQLPQTRNCRPPCLSCTKQPLLANMNDLPEDRSVTYNNAGCRMMAIGNERVALDLFRGALESKLSHERAQGRQQPQVANQDPDAGESNAMMEQEADAEEEPVMEEEDEQEQPEQPQRCVTPDVSDCLDAADEHLAHLDDYIRAATSTDSVSTSAEPLLVGGTIEYQRQVQQQQQSSTSSTTVVPVESRGYNPFICRTPFAIPESDTVPSRNRQYHSAVIVYNLGISHQWFSRYSPKAAAFFEISAALLSSGGGTTEESFLLRICLLNNFGVWCFENGDGDAMRTSLEHLALVLDEQPQLEHSEMVRGMRTNIRFLLTPLNGGSPAA